MELEQRHREFLNLYHTTAHQGLLQERFQPPIPMRVLGDAKGRLLSQQELNRKFARAIAAHHESLWLCHVAQLPFLRGAGAAEHSGLALGLWQAVAGGV